MDLFNTRLTISGPVFLVSRAPADLSDFGLSKKPGFFNVPAVFATYISRSLTFSNIGPLTAESVNFCKS